MDMHRNETDLNSNMYAYGQSFKKVHKFEASDLECLHRSK